MTTTCPEDILVQEMCDRYCGEEDALQFEDWEKEFRKLTIAFKMTTTCPEDLSVEEMCDRYCGGGDALQFEDLEKEFRKICTDYSEEYNSQNTPSSALDFAMTLMYKVRPKYIRGCTKVWKFRFPMDALDKSKLGTVCVTACESSNNYSIPSMKNNLLTLTLMQAELLAIKIITNCNKSQNFYMITPRAGAFFSKEVVPALAEALKSTPAVVSGIINSSCNIGGELLQESKIHVAYIAALAITRNSTKVHRLKEKIIKKYSRKNKQFDKEEFKIYLRYSVLGKDAILRKSKLETEVPVEELISIFNAARSLATQAKKDNLDPDIPSTSSSCLPSQSFSNSP